MFHLSYKNKTKKEKRELTIAVIGMEQSGKTSFIESICHIFPSDLKSQPSKLGLYNEKIAESVLGNHQIILKLTERADKSDSYILSLANIKIFLLDVSQSIELQMSSILKKHENLFYDVSAFKILVMSKMDKVMNVDVETRKNIEAFANKFNCGLVEVDNKGENIRSLINELITTYYEIFHLPSLKKEIKKECEKKEIINAEKFRILQDKFNHWYEKSYKKIKDAHAWNSSSEKAEKTLEYIQTTLISSTKNFEQLVILINDVSKIKKQVKKELSGFIFGGKPEQILIASLEELIVIIKATKTLVVSKTIDILMCGNPWELFRTETSFFENYLGNDKKNRLFEMKEQEIQNSSALLRIWFKDTPKLLFFDHYLLLFNSEQSLEKQFKVFNENYSHILANEKAKRTVIVISPDLKRKMDFRDKNDGALPKAIDQWLKYYSEQEEYHTVLLLNGGSKPENISAGTIVLILNETNGEVIAYWGEKYQKSLYLKDKNEILKRFPSNGQSKEIQEPKFVEEISFMYGCSQSQVNLICSKEELNILLKVLLEKSSKNLINISKTSIKNGSEAINEISDSVISEDDFSSQRSSKTLDDFEIDNEQLKLIEHKNQIDLSPEKPKDNQKKSKDEQGSERLSLDSMQLKKDNDKDIIISENNEKNLSIEMGFSENNTLKTNEARLPVVNSNPQATNDQQKKNEEPEKTLQNIGSQSILVGFSQKEENKNEVKKLPKILEKEKKTTTAIRIPEKKLQQIAIESKKSAVLSFFKEKLFSIIEDKILTLNKGSVKAKVENVIEKNKKDVEKLENFKQKIKNIEELKNDFLDELHKERNKDGIDPSANKLFWEKIDNLYRDYKKSEKILVSVAVIGLKELDKQLLIKEYSKEGSVKFISFETKQKKIEGVFFNFSPINLEEGIDTNIQYHSCLFIVDVAKDIKTQLQLFREQKYFSESKQNEKPDVTFLFINVDSEKQKEVELEFKKSEDFFVQMKGSEDSNPIVDAFFNITKNWCEVESNTAFGYGSMYNSASSKEKFVAIMPEDVKKELEKSSSFKQKK